MIAVIFQTIRKRYLGWLTYGIIGLGLLVLYVALYPSLQQQAASFNQLLKSFPQPILQALGANVSLSSVGGLLVSKQYGLIWPLMAAFLVVSFAGGTIAGEIDNGTLGVLLAQPLSRLKIYLAKYAAGIVGLAAFVGLSITTITPVAAVFNVSVSSGAVWKLSQLGLLFGWALLSAGLMLSSFFSDRGKVYATAGGILLIMYVMNIIADLKDSLRGLKYFSAFYYFNPGTAIIDNRVDTKALWVFIAVIVVTTVVGIYQFQRRDISV